jgi:hypothetical protein
MENSENLAKIGFKTDNGDVETLWAIPVSDNIYRLDNSPFEIYGVSWQDIIKTEPDTNGFPFFTAIVEKSGHRTIRVLVEKDSDKFKDLAAKIIEFGCTYERAFSRLVAIDIPPSVELQKVADYLITAELQWEYADPTYDEIVTNL